MKAVGVYYRNYSSLEFLNQRSHLITPSSALSSL